MSQDDLVIANQTFPNTRADINSNLQALGSQMSGSSAPATTYAYMFWADTTNGVLKQRDATNATWIVVDTLSSARTPSQSSGFTVALADMHKTFLCSAAGGGFTAALPAASVATAGFEVTFIKTDSTANVITLDGNASETINGNTTYPLSGPGDAVTLKCDGSNWRIKSRVSAQFGLEVLVAAATTSELGAHGTNTILIDGSGVTITGLGVLADINDPIFIVRFDGANTVQAHPTALILPGGLNIGTQAGDSMIAKYEGGPGNWRVIAYFRNANLYSPPLGQIYGCAPSSIAGTSTTASLSVSSGQATDTSGSKSIISFGYSWLVSNGNAINGYDGGTTLPNSSTIHFYLISGSSGTGVFASTSLSPTLPAGYNSYSRRIFSCKTTGAGALIPYKTAETFGGALICYLTTIVDDSAAVTTTASLKALSIPTGAKHQPLFRDATASVNGAYMISSPDETDIAPSATAAIPYCDGKMNNSSFEDFSGAKFVTTDTSAQVRLRGTLSLTLNIYTRGWIDFRRS